MVLSFLRAACLLALSVPFAALGAVYTVNTHADNGTGTMCSTGGSCSLRAAIAAAQANPGTDRIEFDLPQGTLITLLSALPTINDKLIIDARPSTDYAGRPWIELNGFATSDAAGLRFGNGAAGSAVYGLAFTDWDDEAILLTGSADGVTIDGVEIGRKINSITAGNGSGIVVLTDGNTIGKRYVEGTGFVGAGNLIIASAGDGIAIVGDANTVYGNRLGDTAASTGNNVGIRVLTGNENHIGRVEPGANGGNGVYFSAAQGIWIAGDLNLVQGNTVGRTSGGSNRPNGGDGIVVGGQSNVIGGTGAFERNLVANSQTGIAVGLDVTDGFNDIIGNHVMDNRGTGIRILSGIGNFVQNNRTHGNGTGGVGDGIRIDSNANVIRSNRIGVDGGNSGEGIFISAFAENNTIGPANLFGNNTFNGVKIQGKSNSVLENTIGTLAAPNGGHGVWLVLGSDDSVVEGNTINGNASHGIRIDSDGALVQENLVGTTTSNGLNGIHLGPDASGNQIGPENLVGLNKDGIGVEGSGNVLIGNLIGTALADEYLPNDRYGIWVASGASGTRIEHNRIGNNGSHGLLLHAAAIVTANDVGGYLQSGAFVSMGNEGHGVFVQGADGVDIGDGTEAGLNRIVYNRDGVAIESSTGTIVDRNLIGANLLSGVALLANAEDTQVTDNEIRQNFSKAIHVGHNAGLRNSFRANRMSANVVPGIDLAGDGPTANDPGDVDEGPNRLQNTPVLHFYSPVGITAVQVGYSVDSIPGNSDYPLVVDLFMGHPFATGGSFEGQVHLGSGIYTAQGVTTLTVALPPEPSGWLIATATDDAGNTSEFSPAIPYILAHTSTIFLDGFED